MTTWLYILPQPTEDLAAQPCWVIRSSKAVTETVLGDCAHWLAAEPVKVLLPLERFAWHLSAPWRHRRQPTAEALLYEVEERVVQPIEGLRAWRGQRDAQRRYELWITDAQSHGALVSYLRQALPELVSLHIDGDLCGPHQSGALWMAGRWLVGGEGLPRLAASDTWLKALEHTRGEPVDRLPPPDSLWQLLERRGGLNLLEGQGNPMTRPVAVAVAIGACVFGLLCAAEYRVGSALVAGNLALLQRNEQRLAQLYPDRRIDPGALSRLAGAKPERRASVLSELTALLQQLDANPDVRVQTMERSSSRRWRLTVSAERLENIQFERKRWRMLDVTAEGGRWHGTLEEGGS